MSDNVQLARDLRDATYRMRRLFRMTSRDGANAVDHLDEIASDVDRIANLLNARPKSPAAIVAPGRMEPGNVTNKSGRTVIVERVAPRAPRAPRRTAIGEPSLWG